MAGLDPVVLALGAGGVAGKTALLAESVKPSLTAGDYLVYVRLVTRVEDHGVRRGVEHSVQCKRELHHTEVRPKVSAGGRHLLHQKLSDLRGQNPQFSLVETTKISW